MSNVNYENIRKNFEEIGVLKNSDIEIVKLSNGKKYALNGWNGEEYLECFEVDEFNCSIGDSPDVTLKPVHRYELIDNFDFDEVEENSEEWYLAVEIVDYEID